MSEMPNDLIRTVTCATCRGEVDVDMIGLLSRNGEPTPAAREAVTALQKLWAENSASVGLCGHILTIVRVADDPVALEAFAWAWEHLCDRPVPGLAR